jgi:hypothetical protein
MTGSASANFSVATSFSGAQQVPPVDSPGTGYAIVFVDPAIGTLNVNLNFSGLTSNTIAAHLHCCATTHTNSGVAIDLVPAGFPLGDTSGQFARTFDLNNPDTYNPTFLSESGTVELARARMIQSLKQLFDPDTGLSYLNIHTTMHPDGELRGNLPEPATILLVVCGLAIRPRQFVR